MKRILGLLLLLCLCASGAWAADYGTAVVDATSGKLHLRAEATAYSDSLGLYFTGTEVECLSEPWREWVHVQIGYQRGYMLSKYLKTGSAADRVQPRFMSGRVTAKNWGRLRMGPSTEYEFVGKVNNGTYVTIMGETHEHWYYVQAGRQTGFISGSLIALDGGYTDQPARTSAPAANTGWKAALRSWLASNGDRSYRYDLIDVDGDGIPELAMDTGVEAGGCQIVTYHQGKISVLQTRRRGFTYVPGANVLCNSDGSMGWYYDDVYTIVSGMWVLTASGEYGDNGYAFEGRSMSQVEYRQALSRVYPLASSVTPAFGYTYSSAMNALR